jgi:hypothetical protein
MLHRQSSNFVLSLLVFYLAIFLPNFNFLCPKAFPKVFGGGTISPSAAFNDIDANQNLLVACGFLNDDSICGYGCDNPLILAYGLPYSSFRWVITDVNDNGYH